MEKNEIQEAEAILLYIGTLFTYIHTYIHTYRDDSPGCPHTKCMYVLAGPLPPLSCLVLSCDPLAFVCHPLPSLVAALSLSPLWSKCCQPLEGRSSSPSENIIVYAIACMWLHIRKQACLSCSTYIHMDITACRSLVAM